MKGHYTKTAKLFCYINSKKGSQTNSVPQTVHCSSLSSSNSEEVCELFAKYFSSVFANIGHVDTSTYPPITKETTLCDMRVTTEDVYRRLTALDSNKGAGPDKIPPLFVKTCAKELCVHLTIIYNMSLQSGIFLEMWKTAHIIPIFKSGDRSRCENYRPISILSCFSKVLESLIYDSIYHHVFPVISPNQHGFVKSRSTTTNLLEYKNFICRTFARKGQTDAIYTDFSRRLTR